MGATCRCSLASLAVLIRRANTIAAYFFAVSVPLLFIFQLLSFVQRFQEEGMSFPPFDSGETEAQTC